MNNKLLVLVYIPMLERQFDIYIPVVKKVGAVKNLVIALISEMCEGMIVNDDTKSFYDKSTGEKIDDNQFVKTSGIKNGTKLILY